MLRKYPCWIAAFCIIFIYQVAALQNSHQCIHDTYVTNHDETAMYTVSKQSYPLFSTAASLTVDTTKPIRILLDTTFLEQDKGYSCYKVGEKVDIDGDSHTCQESEILSPERSAVLRNVLLPAAHQRLSELFRITPVAGKLFVIILYC
jgi:hypothetical protein